MLIHDKGNLSARWANTSTGIFQHRRLIHGPPSISPKSSSTFDLSLAEYVVVVVAISVSGLRSYRENGKIDCQGGRVKFVGIIQPTKPAFSDQCTEILRIVCRDAVITKLLYHLDKTHRNVPTPTEIGDWFDQPNRSIGYQSRRRVDQRFLSICE